MSATATENKIIEEPEAHAAEPQVGMGGTTEDGTRAGGADDSEMEGVKLVEGGTQPEGEEPEGQTEGEEKPASAGGGEVETLRTQLAERDAQVQQFDQIAQVLLANPELMQQVERRLGGQNAEDPFAGQDETINKLFAREDGDALRKVIKPLTDEIKELRSKMASMAPRLDHVARATMSSDFAQALASAGLSADVTRSKEFDAHLKSERKNPSFVKTERTDPRYAAQIAANSWRAKSGQRSQWAGQKARVETVKNGNLNGSVSRGANGTAQKVFEIDDTGGADWATKALNIRMKDPAARIVYKSGRK